MVPRESQVLANGLSHHVIEWNGGSRGVFVLCHGYLDIAWSFDAFARRLAAAGYRVFAFDWRGHGDTDWVGAGGYYHFSDYMLDLEELLPRLTGDPVHLLGHSMGATACAYYAGVRSERLRSLTLIEGLGPPEGTESQADRFLAWFDTMGRHRNRERAAMKDIDAAIARMRLQNPDLTDELGRFLAERSTEPHPDGGIRWRFDPYHRTRSPVQFRVDVYLEFLDRISARTLIIGGDRGFRIQDEAERAKHIADHRFHEITDCGHMVHWFRPDALATVVLEFVRGSDL